MISEATLWLNSRYILHFVGVCGAGKTTLSNMLASRCKSYGWRVIGTLDWDPHIADTDRQSERAFSRELDRLNSEKPTPAIHKRILEYSLEFIHNWKCSDANLILVDRWYESYDNLPIKYADEIEQALAQSGFRVIIINLLVNEPYEGDDFLELSARLTHTRMNRPVSWWSEDMGTLQDMIVSESAYQKSYREFCECSPFHTIRLSTTKMKWEAYADDIVGSLLELDALGDTLYK